MERIWAAYDKADVLIKENGENLIKQVYRIFKDARMNVDMKMVETYVAGQQRELAKIK